MTQIYYHNIKTKDPCYIVTKKINRVIRENVALRLPKCARNVPNVFVG